MNINFGINVAATQKDRALMMQYQRDFYDFITLYISIIHVGYW